MNLKEYNSLLDEISNFIKPLNQILYQILILITLYLLFTKLKTNQTEYPIQYTIQYTAQNTQQHKKTNQSFIILFAILAVGLDWFIWNNTIQTALFISIITVYIYYNFKNLNIISTFINFTKELSNAAPIITEPLSKNSSSCGIPILPIPEILINNNKTPLPFDINSTETKEINEVYKSDKPYISITDTKYAEIMLNDLYNTPQYKNIQHDDIDTTLDNNIHFAYNKSNEELINSFKNPKKEFLDSSWLNINNRTYNDNCTSCKTPRKSSNSSSNLTKDITNNPNRGKNAICTVVNFGRELGECTNQEGTINPEQLEKISDNRVIPLNLE